MQKSLKPSLSLLTTRGRLLWCSMSTYWTQSMITIGISRKSWERVWDATMVPRSEWNNGCCTYKMLTLYLFVWSSQVHLHPGLAAAQPDDRVLPVLWHAAPARHASPPRHLSGLRAPLPRHAASPTRHNTKPCLSPRVIAMLHNKVIRSLTRVCPQSWRMCVRIISSSRSALAAAVTSPPTWRWRPFWQVPDTYGVLHNVTLLNNCYITS